MQRFELKTVSKMWLTTYPTGNLPNWAFVMAYVLCSNKTYKFKRLRKDKLHFLYCCNTNYLGVQSLLLSPCWSQMLFTNVSHTNVEWQVTFSETTTPLWLWKDMLHFPSCYHTPLITEGQVTFHLLLPYPPPLIMKGQVTFPLLLQQHPDYRSTAFFCRLYGGLIEIKFWLILLALSLAAFHYFRYNKSIIRCFLFEVW